MLVKEKGKTGRYFVARPDVTNDGIACMYYGWTTDVNEATDFATRSEAVKLMKVYGFYSYDEKIETVERENKNA
jgi:hypothetical protein